MHLIALFKDALVVMALAGAAAAKPLVVDSHKKVTYQGFTSSPGIETFLNIPFAEDTGGKNRFAPPVPYKTSPGQVINATVAGHSCPQTSQGGFLFSTVVTDISEDCLSLKISRPVGHAKPLPVMVYIYGGGLNTGTAYDRTAQPDGLIKQSVLNGLPVMYVGINYRLNIFGFATAESLRGGKSLNVGLKDQRLALEWVQENIGTFGGDPSKVTIFGQSSGGLSVGMQILAYGGSKHAPFRGAIMQSTALEPTMASNISSNATAAIAVAAGCNATNATSTSPCLIDCLRALPMQTLLNITLHFITSTSANNDGDIFLPTVDQDFLPDLASNLVAQGKFSKVSMMAGWQNNDATLFTSGAIQTDADTKAFFNIYYPDLNATTLANLLALYPVSEFTANITARKSAEFYRSAQVFRDILLTCPNFLLGSAMAKKYTNTNSPPVYLYAGNQTILDNYLDSTGSLGLGVIHTSELAYLASNFSIYNVTSDNIPGYHFAPTDADYALAETLPRSWTTFGSTRAPSLAGKNALKGWTSAFPNSMGKGEVYVIGGGNPGMQDCGFERLDERCGFLGQKYVIEQLKY